MKTAVVCASLVLGMGVLPASGLAQDQVSFEASPYYCKKLNGLSSGRQCTASYAAESDACDKFAALGAADARMKRTLDEVRSAQVCLAKTVDEAKSFTLRLRADMMGYVSAGRDERANDPIANSSFKPREGSATYQPYVAYMLYQCVVETCTKK